MPAHRSRPPRSAARLLRALGLAALLLAAACGSDSDDDTGDAAETATTLEAPAETSAAGESSDPPAETAPAAEAGSSLIVVTAADGTVYEFTDVSSCDTSATDPSGFPIENGFDLTGRTADGAFSFSVGRAGFEEELVVFAGTLQGDFDADGRNAQMLYSLGGEGLDLIVDGPTVTGTVESSAILPNRPHGDDVLLTVDASC